jgi:hypothetical protein
MFLSAPPICIFNLAAGGAGDQKERASQDLKGRQRVRYAPDAWRHKEITSETSLFQCQRVLAHPATHPSSTSKTEAIMMAQAARSIGIERSNDGIEPSEHAQQCYKIGKYVNFLNEALDNVLRALTGPSF